MYWVRYRQWDLYTRGTYAPVVASTLFTCQCYISFFSAIVANF
jgi:hypothetical protein